MPVKRLISHWSLVLLLALLVAGCGGDDESNPTGSNSNPVDLSSAQVDIPAAMSNAAGSNSGAAQAVGLINLANSFSNYDAWWTPPSPGAKTGLPYFAAGVDTTISWSQDGVTVTRETNENSIDKTWTVTLNGSDGTHTYNDFVFIDGYALLDGSDGSMSVYDPDSPQNTTLTWTWGIDPSQTFFLNLSIAESNGYISIDVPNTGGGSVTHTINGVNSFSATWQSDGSGSYTIYDSGGTPTDTGTWPGA